MRHGVAGRVLLILTVVISAVFGCRIAFSYYLNALWFGSLGYRDVFWKTQAVRWAAFTAFATAS